MSLIQTKNIQIKAQNKQQLQWSSIQQDCVPIGDQGWHADAFYNKTLGLIAKKMRIPDIDIIEGEIKNLNYLSNFLPIRCHHQIMNKGEAIGLTMNFIPGVKWDSILQVKGNIFQNPIARVIFVVKLAQQIKLLQTNRFVHGDLHLSNILIHIKKIDEIYPQFNIQVIDFGNGYIFQEGKLVSQGMTGMSIIVPFEAESVKKNNYNPIGINAYQLGRNALQILLLSKHSQAQSLEYYATKQLKILQQHTQYPKQLFTFINGLLHQQPAQRNIYLFNDINGFVQETRLLYKSNIDK